MISYLVVMATVALALSCRWRTLKKIPFLARSVAAVSRRVRGLAHRVADRWRAPEPPPDPFEALHVQMRLQTISHEIRQLHDDETIYARAARLKARTIAYDALLQSACDLAGVIDLDHLEAAGESDARTERELQLTERGWFW